MSANFRLVAHAAQSHADEFASSSSGNALPEPIKGFYLASFLALMECADTEYDWCKLALKEAEYAREPEGPYED